MLPPFRSKFGAVWWRDMDAPGIEYEWIIKGILPRREIVLLFGESQAGKSFEMFNIGMSVARGLDFHGRKTRKGLVVYCALEAGKGFKKRLRAYKKYHEITEDVPFVVLTSRADLHASDTDIDNLIIEIKALAGMSDWPLELVVLDTWSAGTRGANENSGEDVSKILNRVYRLKEECGTAVAIVHHKPKAANTPRGHGSLTADIETTIEVVATEMVDADMRPIRKATLLKQREGESGVSWQFVIKQVVLGTDEEGDPITSCVTAPIRKLEAEDTGSHEVVLRSDSARTVLRALVDALKAKGVPPPPGVQAPKGAKVVHRNEWRDQLLLKSGADEKEQEARSERVRKAVERAIDKFQGFKIIGAHHPYVWLTGRPVQGFILRGLVQSTEQEEEEKLSDISDSAVGDFIDQL